MGTYIRSLIAAPMPDRCYHVLFLDLGNSAWSPMAEALMNHAGKGIFRAHSAGLRPVGALDPFALHQLRVARLSVEDFRSRRWDEFTDPGSPRLDFVFCACDPEAEGICPAWPGDPLTALWRVPDPSLAEGPESARMGAFHRSFMLLQNRIHLFLALPLDKVGRMGPTPPARFRGRASLEGS